MLTRGAEHQGGVAVPPIRVGVGGHRPRRTSQHALSRQSKYARGSLRKKHFLRRVPLTHQTLLNLRAALSRRGRGHNNGRLARCHGCYATFTFTDLVVSLPRMSMTFTTIV